MPRRICGGGEFLRREITCQDVFTPEDFSDEHKQIATTTEQFVAREIQPVNKEIEDEKFWALTGKAQGMRRSGIDDDRCA